MSLYRLSPSQEITVSLSGSLTVAPKEWDYSPRLVDKWGFLAKTVLILERLKGIVLVRSGCSIMGNCFCRSKAADSTSRQYAFMSGR